MELLDLRGRIAGDVVLPGDPTWDTARQAWNLAVDQRPVAVVYPESADDVAATVGLAAEHGFRIAFNAGGHNAGPIDWTEPTVLLKTERMTGIQIDAEARRARVEAGVLSQPPRRRGRGARPRVPRRDVTECRRARLRARGRPQLADPDARARVQQHRGGRGRHGGRPPDPRRPRHRARAVLGDPRRWWQRRRGDIDRARAVSDPGDLCRWPVLADRPRHRGPQRVADVDRDRARGVRIPRADAAAARRPVPPRAPARPRVRPGRARVHRQRRRRRRPRPVAAGPRSRVRHGRDHAGEGPQPREPGPGGPAALLGRGAPADGPHARGDRQDGRGRSSARRSSTSRFASSAAPPRSARPTTACSTRSTSRSSASASG